MIGPIDDDEFMYVVEAGFEYDAGRYRETYNILPSFCIKAEYEYIFTKEGFFDFFARTIPSMIILVDKNKAGDARVGMELFT